VSERRIGWEERDADLRKKDSSSKEVKNRIGPSRSFAIGPIRVAENNPNSKRAEGIELLAFHSNFYLFGAKV
jgi:hypothetical protein